MASAWDVLLGLVDEADVSGKTPGYGLSTCDDLGIMFDTDIVG